jgi:hypothetical protein
MVLFVVRDGSYLSTVNSYPMFVTIARLVASCEVQEIQ